MAADVAKDIKEEVWDKDSSKKFDAEKDKAYGKYQELKGDAKQRMSETEREAKGVWEATKDKAEEVWENTKEKMEDVKEAMDKKATVTEKAKAAYSEAVYGHDQSKTSDKRK